MCDRRAVSRQTVIGIPECNGPAQRGELIARDRVSRGAFQVLKVLSFRRLPHKLLEAILMPDNIHVLSHPLVNTRLAKLRQVSTTSKEFREVSPSRLSGSSVPDSATGDP
jgi:hypothetical protein